MEIEVLLNKLLKERELSLYRLSKDTGISYQQLSAIAKNRTKRIDFNTISAICEQLNCDIPDLISFKPKK